MMTLVELWWLALAWPFLAEQRSAVDLGLPGGSPASRDVEALVPDQRRTSDPTPTPTPAPSAPVEGAACVPRLQALGNRIVAAGSNQPVLLRGVNIMEAEWRDNFVWESAAIPHLASDWNGKIVIHGFASEPVNANNAAYLALLDSYVSTTRANGVYLVFSWRSVTKNGPQPAYPDASARTALAALAARYKNEPHVMYSLQVEPHDVAWSFVRPIFEGMVDAIRNAAAPSNPLIFIPGTEWGKDISGAITNPVNRPNIVYKSHPYTSAAYFQQYFGSAVDAGLPVFIGEFAPTQWLSMTDIQSLLSYTRQKAIGWAAWGYEYDANPPLITTSLTPTNSYGLSIMDIGSLLSYARWAAWGYEYDANPPLITSWLTPTDSFGTTVRNEMLTTPAIPSCS